MMEARAPALDEPGDWRLGAQRLEEFDTTDSAPEEDDRHVFGWNRFSARRVFTQHGLEGRNGGSQGIDGNSDVIDLDHSGSRMAFY
jgi:hypothetical protein